MLKLYEKKVITERKKSRLQKILNTNFFRYVKTIGIITPENPYNADFDGNEIERRTYNNEMLKEFKAYLKNAHYVYIPIQGKFGGFIERSFVIQNIDLKTLKNLASLYQQTSFIYAYITNKFSKEGKDEVVFEYWEVPENEKKAPGEKGPYSVNYQKSQTRNISLDQRDTDDNYSYLGDKKKFTIPFFDDEYDLGDREIGIEELIKDTNETKILDDPHNFMARAVNESGIQKLQILSESYSRLKENAIPDGRQKDFYYTRGKMKEILSVYKEGRTNWEPQ